MIGGVTPPSLFGAGRSFVHDVRFATRHGSGRWSYSERLDFCLLPTFDKQTEKQRWYFNSIVALRAQITEAAEWQWNSPTAMTMSSLPMVCLTAWHSFAAGVCGNVHAHSIHVRLSRHPFITLHRQSFISLETCVPLSILSPFLPR